MPLLLHIVCCFSFVHSLLSIYPLPSILLRFFSFFLHFSSVLPSSLTAFYLLSSLSTVVLSNFLSLFFGCLHFLGFFPTHFVVDTVAVTIDSPHSFCSSALKVKFARRRGRSHPGCPSVIHRAQQGMLSCRVRPAERGVKPGQVPCVPGGARWRRAAAAVWLGSEEPGQLLPYIKSQLWFLSGEPLSKGTDTKLRGLAHFLH